MDNSQYGLVDTHDEVYALGQIMVEGVASVVMAQPLFKSMTMKAEGKSQVIKTLVNEGKSRCSSISILKLGLLVEFRIQIRNISS